MKVGYVLRYWPTVSETFVAREIDGLRARGVAVDVVGIGRRADGADDAVPSLRPEKVPIRALRHLVRPDVRRLVRGMRRRDVARALWVADRGADRGWSRIHAHFAGEAAEWARVAAAVLGVPWSVTVHAVDLFVPRPSLGGLLRDARPAITICAHHRRWIAERFGADALVVRCGVPLDVPRAEPGAAGARFVCVARDVPKKGLDALATAIAALPGATLRLVSDAVRLGGPRIAAGSLAPDAVPDVLARAQVFVLPCRIAPNGDRDGIPVALMEAMAAGLPVIATRVAGIPELVDDTVGWLVPPDDPAALLRAMREACEPGERARRGRAARERIVTGAWTVDRQVAELVQAWALPRSAGRYSPSGGAMDLTVRHEQNPSGGRFVLERRGEGVGLLTWSREAPGRVSADHTEVDDSLQGQGAGGRLFDALVAWARESGEKVVPRCAFVKAQLERHPETRDIAA